VSRQQVAASSINAVAWFPARELDYPEWTAAGRRLGALGRCGQWGLGDWIRYGNARFGERYSKAAEITGYDVQTLRNMVYVASRFEMSRRRDNLSWSHHEALAAMATSDQDDWLDRSVSNKLSVADLRVELRSARLSKHRAGLALAGIDEVADKRRPRPIVCPTCGYEIERKRAVSSTRGVASS
jgi:hypothetical protein